MKAAIGALLLIAALTGSAHAEPLPGATVESLLAAAREHSPDIRMVRLEAEAARERIQPAGALPTRYCASSWKTSRATGARMRH